MEAGLVFPASRPGVIQLLPISQTGSLFSFFNGRQWGWDDSLIGHQFTRLLLGHPLSPPFDAYRVPHSIFSWPSLFSFILHPRAPRPLLPHPPQTPYFLERIEASDVHAPASSSPPPQNSSPAFTFPSPPVSEGAVSLCLSKVNASAWAYNSTTSFFCQDLVPIWAYIFNRFLPSRYFLFTYKHIWVFPSCKQNKHNINNNDVFWILLLIIHCFLNWVQIPWPNLQPPPSPPIISLPSTTYSNKLLLFSKPAQYFFCTDSLSSVSHSISSACWNPSKFTTCHLFHEALLGFPQVDAILTSFPLHSTASDLQGPALFPSASQLPEDTVNPVHFCVPPQCFVCRCLTCPSHTAS